jgi:hypothetical protein
MSLRGVKATKQSRWCGGEVGQNDEIASPSPVANGLAMTGREAMAGSR